jgi:biopolymer transport protein ExbD
MRIRGTNKAGNEIKLDMTSMIDIVFQLLAYFILTFKITSMEGDFSVNMPMAANTSQQIMENLDKTIVVRLTRTADGNVGPIDVDFGADHQSFADELRFQRLRDYVKSLVLQPSDPAAGGEYEVEFDIDRDLAYDFTIRAVEAVSGEPLGGGRITPLIEKIRFRDNRPQ